MAFDLAKYQKESLTIALAGSKASANGKSALSSPLFNKKLTNKIKEELYMQLSMLLSSEINVKEALQLIVDESKNNSLKKIFGSVYKKISQDGSYFSHAILNSGYFTPFEYYLLEIGEKTGRLKEIAQRLSAFYSNKIKQQRQLSGILVYPMIVLVSTFGLLYIMLEFIVPTYSKILKGFNSELPLITKYIMKSSELMGIFLPPLLGAISLISVIAFFSRKKNWFRKISSGLVLKIPYVGALVKKQYMSRFCYSLGFLLNSNVEVYEVLKLVKKTIQYYPIESTLDEIMKDINSDKQLSESLIKFKIYDTKLISLIRMSEGVKRVGYILEKVSEQNEKEIEHQSNMMGAIIQPILIIIIGTIVTIVALGIFLPMFQLGKVRF